MTYAIGCLNPYFSYAVFVKEIDASGKRCLFTSLPDREGLPDAMLFTLARARDMLELMPPHSFLIECSEADQNRMLTMREEP